jgi:hypothetical protein
MQTSRNKLNFFETVKTIYLSGGITRFWRGSMLIGAASVPAHSLYFSVYEIMKNKLGVNETVRVLYIKLGIPICSLRNDGGGSNFFS